MIPPSCLRFLLLPLLLASALAAPVPASAQRPADLNQAAGALFEKGRFQAAARLLQVVLQLQPSARAHRNLALCFAKIRGKEEQAVLHMQAYLRARPQAKDRPLVERMIADLDARIAGRGSVAFIESVPAKASVFLDDGPKPLGTTPLRARLPLGTHSLRIERVGYETIRRTVEVQVRQRLQVAFALTPTHLPGYIVVRADVPSPTVTIDGRPAKLGRNTTNPGAHQVRVAKAGREAWDAEIRVRPGGTTEVVARLPVARPPPPPPTPPRPYRVWKWVTFGASALAAGLGIIAYSRAVMDSNRAAALDGQSFPDAQSFQDAVAREQRSASRNIDLARIALAGGIAAAGVTVALFLLDRRPHGDAAKQPPTTHIGIAPVPGGAMATFGARF